MHHTLFEELRVKTFLMQFYYWFSRGFFSADEKQAILRLNDENVKKLEIMKDPSKWDGDYSFIFSLLPQTDEAITKGKNFLIYKQICKDKVIADYLHHNPDLFQKGIDLKSLRSILDIQVLFRNGYMLHDIFWGYPEKDMYRFQIDCLDYVYSASHFYNEGYAYYHNKKEIKTYNEIPHEEIGPFEFTRIQLKDEVMFRNFREAYINIILFIESFINSVGFDAFLDGKASNSADELKLRGIQGVRKNGRYNYSTLINKIEDITRIIGGSSVDITKEPFADYLNQDIELRNTYIHSSPDKQKPLLSIDDWKVKCDELIEDKCHSILNSFWKACYPNRPFPGVIFNSFHGNAFKGIQHKMVAYQA